MLTFHHPDFQAHILIQEYAFENNIYKKYAILF